MQRELLACDAEEPLEIWGGKKPLRYQLCGYCFFLNLKKIYIYISLELLGMFIDDDVLCATEL